MRKRAVKVVFDERDSALRQDFNQPLLLFIRHATAERVAVIEREEAGFDVAATQAFRQFIEANSVSGEGWDFARSHAEGLDDLQYAVVGRRLDGDGVAGTGDGAQAKVQRFLAATRGDNFIRRQGATGLHRPARDLRS